MKSIRHAIALAAFLAATQTLATTPKDYHVTTMGELIELCSVSVGDPLFEAAMGFCFGYIDAALDYHVALTAGPTFDPIACPHQDITREEVVVVVVEWSRGNPQQMDSEAPVAGVMRAVSEKWPCAGH